MSSFYDRMGALSGKLMNRFGAPATLTRKTAAEQSAYDPRTGKTTVIPSSVVTLPCLAVAKPRTTRLDNGILHHDTVMTLTVEPTVGDEISQGERTYKVEAVEAVAPTGVALIYRAVVTL
ncbi:hypothetical protein ASE85_03285 [Sphingobium sp. Leaf26]|uniref:hypothetical protein n=1 Tax=Sphingobium sp. Leaf26 TaxID=1735693 RepID=UPI0006F9FA86|nr:hypothetical protein [Sphingobium sp. Leaf26]KQN09967.1 hypothetical protein ASE85_03285 [Sphingobium sp. Leaf26]